MKTSQGSGEGLYPIQLPLNVQFLQDREQLLASSLGLPIGSGAVGLAGADLNAKSGAHGGKPLAHKLGATVRVHCGGDPKGFPTPIQKQMCTFFGRELHFLGGAGYDPTRKPIHAQ